VNYTQVRAFDAVARAGSFSRAAEALGLTQPALTIQVRALEDRYGVKLLIRQGRGVTLTPAGEQLFRVSRQMAGLEEQAHDLLTESQQLHDRSLRIASDGPHIVMGLFARFLVRHPGVKLSVAMGNTRFVREDLLERRADLAILPGVGDHAGIHAEPLWHHRAVVIVAPGHPWQDRKAVTLADLAGGKLIAREEGSMTQQILDRALAEAGLAANIVLRLGSREALCEAVAAGLGCGVVWELEAERRARLRSIPLTEPQLTSTDYIACLKSERSRRVIRAFFQEAASLPGERHDTAALRAALERAAAGLRPPAC
jgi:aminoethylphosphonate catabolism LysR family transcriptional regulator